ncbi:MAG: hypothetical protein QF568_05815, partial [Flavobacteriales bacterium]|nr:hypothetical protein [Flavobacteriales bacterium]
KNKKGVAIYDAEQIIGDGEGLGININQKYIDKITKVRIVIWLENSNVFKEEIVGKVNKKEIIGKQKTILKHPRY